MLDPITIRYPSRPGRRSLATGRVADLFGLPPDHPPHAVAEGLTLDVRPGDLVLFTGPSGSGKSSILRAVSRQLNAVEATAIELPDLPLIDALPGPVDDRLAALAGCGLSEARLLGRTPAELSDGQRYRFRLAYAMSLASRGREPLESGRPWVLADEFAAVLDRPLAKVVAFNLRKLVDRLGVGVLAATTHDDVAADLSPDLWVRCLGDGVVTAERPGRKRRPLSFADEFWLSDGSRSDWSDFARWHYRGHALGPTRRVTVLWHGREPAGVCVFAAPAASLPARSAHFGLGGRWSGVGLAALNEQLWLLQRVVLHPTYRGAGVGAGFVRRACELSPVDWVETLTAMGHANPVFERAGFVRVPHPAGVKSRRRGRGAVAARRRPGPAGQPVEPAYYVFDNRRRPYGGGE